MANMIELIKKAAVEAVAASKPAVVEYGQVISASPLRIQLDQKRTIDEDFIVPTQSLAGLVPGDRIVMIKVQGGQSYVMIDKVV